MLFNFLAAPMARQWVFFSRWYAISNVFPSHRPESGAVAGRGRSRSLGVALHTRC